MDEIARIATILGCNSLPTVGIAGSEEERHVAGMFVEQVCMTQQLTQEELQLAFDAVEYVQRRQRLMTPTDLLERFETTKAKLQAGITALTQRSQLAGTVEPEQFPKLVTREEAQQYNDIGEELMLKAAKIRVDEGTHHKLSCLLIGLTTALSRIMHVPRERFCNTLVSNVMFTAIKAGYTLPSANRAEPADGSGSQ